MKKIIACAFVYIITIATAFSIGMEYERFTTIPPKPEIVYIEKPVVQEVEKSDISNEIVYVTDTGKRYHESDCPYLRSRKEMRLAIAKTAYTPCGKCLPIR